MAHIYILNLFIQSEFAVSAVNGARVIFKSFLLAWITREGFTTSGKTATIFIPGYYFCCDCLASFFFFFNLFAILSVLYLHYSFTIFSTVFQKDLVLERASETRIVMFKVAFSTPFLWVLPTVRRIPSLWDDSEASVLKKPNKTLRLCNHSWFSCFPIFKWGNCS